MKLLKAHKEAIVDRIMKDVPRAITLDQVNSLYQQEMEAAHNAVVPPEVLKLAKSSHTTSYFKWDSETLPRCLGQDRHTLSSELTKIGAFREYHTHLEASQIDPEKVAKKTAKMLRALLEQEDRRDEMRRQLMANLSDVKSSETLIKRFPEFEKYLPKEQAGSFPVATSNLIASLSKMGWSAAAQGAAA